MHKLRWLIAQQVPNVVLAVWITLISIMILRVTESSSKAARYRIESRSNVARAVAEEVAWAMATDPEAEPELKIQRFGFRAIGKRYASVDEDRLVIRVGEHEFRCDVLDGAAPTAFRRPLSIAGRPCVQDPDWAWLGQHNVPEPQWLGDRFPVPEPAEFFADRRAESAGFLIDDSVALGYLAAGTDRRDFVLDVGRNGVCSPEVGDSGVVHLDGNLWLLGRGGRIVIELGRPLTVFVHGNIYVGNSVVVQGRGRLVLAALEPEGAEPYVDRDFDGRFSPGDTLVDGGTVCTGWIEGGGSIYIGLPRRDQRVLPKRRAGSSGVFDIDAAIVSYGHVYLSGRRTRPRDALVLGRGLRMLDRFCVLEFRTAEFPQSSRRRLAGFECRGGPRPSLLIAH